MDSAATSPHLRESIVRIVVARPLPPPPPTYATNLLRDIPTHATLLSNCLAPAPKFSTITEPIVTTVDVSQPHHNHQRWTLVMCQYTTERPVTLWLISCHCAVTLKQRPVRIAPIAGAQRQRQLPRWRVMRRFQALITPVTWQPRFLWTVQRFRPSQTMTVLSVVATLPRQRPSPRWTLATF